MIYNTNFKVKYHDIEEELILKLNNKPNDEEYEYTSGDVIDICRKLYCDELASVFFAKDLLDDKIDIGIKTILEKVVKENTEFKEIIEDIKQWMLLNKSINFDDYYVFIILFSENLFWLTHQCICQQLTMNTIEKTLLETLRKNTVELL